MQIPLNGTYRLTENFGFSMDILSQFDFLTIASYTESNRNYSWWQFGLYAVEFNPGFEYTKSRMNFSLRYRAFQVRKIDPVLFNHIVKDEDTGQNFETYNPFKLWFSIGYSL